MEKLKGAALEVDIKTGMSPEELERVIPDYNAIIVRSATKVKASVIEAGKNLKLIARGGVGLDNIDVEAARARGITVLNTPGASARSVAELAVGLMFAVLRKISWADAALKRGRWEKKRCQGQELGGKTLGVVGTGSIGREVIRMAKGLGMEVMATKRDLSQVPPELEELGVPLIPLDDLLRQADIVTLHLPATDDTKNLFDASTIAKMKKGAVLINCARGGIVDEAALAEALEKGHLSGAGVDVFAEEPPPEDNPLLKFENVVLMPHAGASTDEGQFRVGLEVAEKVIEALK
ncbi:MAG: hydroxyacid dehydrogenase [Nitrospinota bacterium]